MTKSLVPPHPCAHKASGTLRLPTSDGGWEDVELAEPRAWARHPKPFRMRVAFAAAHVVADPLAENVPGAPAQIDWDSTLGFREQLFQYGFGVAEAMDTAQRNMGLDWSSARELIARSALLARSCGGRIAAGAGTDHVGALRSQSDVIAAYCEQVEYVESTGSQVILMASRQLASLARGAETYYKVYGEVLRQTERPVIVHWLGKAFDPLLTSYWGSEDVAVATDNFLSIVRDHADRIDGVKVSLLSYEHECQLRLALPEGVRMYTGDDFNYPELIRGDSEHHSDALLGAFAAVFPAASVALAALDEGDVDLYDAEMASTLPLSRHIFETPTYHYKTGIAFLAWLCGYQPGFTMVAGLQSARSVIHLSRLFALANNARLLPDPDLAANRMRLWLETAGIKS